MPSGQDYHGALMDATAEARDALGRMAALGRAKAEAEREIIAREWAADGR